jgi:hypothetical protein
VVSGFVDVDFDSGAMGMLAAVLSPDAASVVPTVVSPASIALPSSQGCFFL